MNAKPGTLNDRSQQPRSGIKIDFNGRETATDKSPSVCTRGTFFAAARGNDGSKTCIERYKRASSSARTTRFGIGWIVSVRTERESTCQVFCIRAKEGRENPLVRGGRAEFNLPFVRPETGQRNFFDSSSHSRTSLTVQLKRYASAVGKIFRFSFFYLFLTTDRAE